MVFTHELRGDTIDFCTAAAESLAAMVADLTVDSCYHLVIPIVKTGKGCPGGNKKRRTVYGPPGVTRESCFAELLI